MSRMPCFLDLAEKPLPLLPQTAEMLHRLLGQHHVRTPDLQRVILQDPAATMAIFRHLHKLRPGSTAEVADIAHAASLIGFSAFQHLLTGLPTITASQATRLEAARVHYSINAHAGIFAKNWSEISGLSNPTTQATAAVLQNPAPLVLAVNDPEAALRAQNATRSGVAHEVAYSAEFGIQAREANQALAHRWGYPSHVFRPEQLPDQQNVGASIVSLAARLARSSALDWRSADPLLLSELAGLLNQSEDLAAAGFHALAASAARELHPLGFPSIAFSVLQARIEDALTPEEQRRLDPILARMNQSLAPPAAGATINPLQRALTTTLDGIVKDARVRCVVFAMLNGDRSRLRTRLALGGRPNDPIRQLNLGTQQRHLFSLLLAKAQSLWVTDANRGKYQALFPEELADALNRTDFFAMSLIVDGRPIGVLYADGPLLTEDGYAKFRRRCRQAVAHLSRNSKAA